MRYTNVMNRVANGLSSPLPKETLYALQLYFVVNAAVSPYWKLIAHFKTADAALQAPETEWKALGLHQNHVNNFQKFKAKDVVLLRLMDACMTAIASGYYDLITTDDILYPKQLHLLSDKPPLLFVRGDKQALSQAQVAMVGTRKPSHAARDVSEHFAQQFAVEGLWVTSGLADGIDRHAHIGALKQQHGRTVAVLGNGITTCYPKANQRLYDAILAQGGAIISEFLPEAKPMAHHFPRRNRIVSGLSLATLVVEAAQNSGSLITARLAAEQGKAVFAIPGHIYNTQAKGCHELIREGAILVDEPTQVIEDINLPRRLHVDMHAPSQVMSSAAESQQVDLFASFRDVIDVGTHDTNTHETHPSLVNASVNSARNRLPAHLETLLNQLDWVGQDMDKLINLTNLHIAELSSQLMELELMGLAVQQGGMYLRCRP